MMSDQSGDSRYRLLVTWIEIGDGEGIKYVDVFGDEIWGPAGCDKGSDEREYENFRS